MKKIITLLVSMFCTVVLSAQTIAVWGFESDNFCLEDKIATMSDLLIDELVGINGITIVERTKLDAVLQEMDFQNGIYTDPETVKSVGKMTNADCVITGNTTIIGGEFVATARLIEVESGKILHTAKMRCRTWTEFYDAIPKFAQEIVNRVPSPNRLLGTWICETSDESYTIIFDNKNKCSIETTSEMLTGGYTLSKDKMSGVETLKINAHSTDKKTKILWNSICSFSTPDYSSFNIQIKNSEGKTIRATFIKSE